MDPFFDIDAVLDNLEATEKVISPHSLSTEFVVVSEDGHASFAQKKAKIEQKHLVGTQQEPSNYRPKFDELQNGEQMESRLQMAAAGDFNETSNNCNVLQSLQEIFDLAAVSQQITENNSASDQQQQDPNSSMDSPPQRFSTPPETLPSPSEELLEDEDQEEIENGNNFSAISAENFGTPTSSRSSSTAQPEDFSEYFSTNNTVDLKGTI